MIDQRTSNDLDPWRIRTAGDLSWAMNKYEENIKTGKRRSARFLFNQLFDFGMKLLNDKIKISETKQV